MKEDTSICHHVKEAAQNLGWAAEDEGINDSDSRRYLPQEEKGCKDCDS